jgi:hypothetical protein
VLGSLGKSKFSIKTGVAVALNGFFTRRRHVDDAVEARKATLETKEEQRQMEFDYLKPEPLTPYTGTDPNVDPILALSVKLVFPDKPALAQFKRHFKVAKYVEPSVTNIGVLLAILDELDAGRIVYDKSTDKISYTTTEIIEIQPVKSANTDVLVAVLNEFAAGRIEYNAENKRITYPDRPRQASGGDGETSNRRRDSKGSTAVVATEQAPHRTK